MILVRHGQSHFNVHFAKTRIDPGIVDPGLTEEGERQAQAAGEGLTGQGIKRIVASPYWRTLHTAEIIAETLGLPVAIDPRVRERYFFTCDIGSHRSDLTARWPGFGFGDLPERWWPEEEETEDALGLRCADFRSAMLEQGRWDGLLIVSHWGFIRGLTGEAVGNGVALRFDPHQGAVSAAL
ncbi:histidine phosphatase family protein [Pelagibius litoralis]|uniref:Histidine phosphatase family protein n=1 Tax=Pelagibius litoralis TaxID=374515 RepID=A0A967KHX7_9PROT|nr:histidine phosphatase family protein [Pelagibius litoralis]NIA71716.1 histidine phosphatase family protein [Pelagibius litoralis]